MDNFAADLWRLPPPFNMIVLIVLIVFVSGLLSELAGFARKYFSHRQELQLKRDLVDRGLSVDEVERVVRAGNAGGDKKA